MYRYYFIVILTASLVLGDINKLSSQDSIYFNKRECFESYSRDNHSEGIISTDTGYLLAGISSGPNYGFDKINIAYFDLFGNKQKVKTFGTGEFLYYLGFSGCFFETSDGNLLLVGYRKNATTFTKDVGFVMKVNPDFDSLWSKTYTDTTTNPIKHYYFFQGIETIDNYFMFTGLKKPDGKNSNVLLIKADSTGNVISEFTYGQGGNIYENGYSVIETIDKGYLLGCIRYDYRFHESHDPIVIKIDSAMQFQWEKNIGGPYRDGKALVTKSIDNNYIIGTDIADSMLTPYVSYSRINIIKMDTAGNIIWNKRYGPSAIDNRLSSLCCYENGTIVASGSLYKIGLYKFGWLLKVDCNGDSLWMRYYDFLQANSSQNIIYDFKKDYYNGYIACGDLLPFPPDTGNRDIWLLKVDSVGCDTPGCDPTIIIPHIPLIDNLDCKVSPNPVTDVSTLEYPGIPNGEVLLSVYDCQGRLLLYRKYKPYEKIIISNNQFKPGIHFFRLHIGKSWHSGKFVVL